MKVGAAIYSMLKDDSAVSALVGTRIYPELAEEGAATPYVVYSVVSNTPIDTKDSAPVDEAQLEVFSVADTYAAANDLADKVRTALSRKSKIVFDTVSVQSIKYTNEVTEVSAERNLFISVQDYTVRTTPVLPRPVYLFDNYSGATMAYSLRQLDFNYTGAAVKVRRDSDDTEQDIGFDDYGNLDVVALQAFCSGTDGYVSRWYDQANSNDLVQTDSTKQGQIVENGVALKDDDRNYYIECLNAEYNPPVQVPQPFTAFAVARLDAVRRIMFNYVLWSASGGHQQFRAGGDTMIGTLDYTNGEQYLHSVYADAANTELRLNGATDLTGATTNPGTRQIHPDTYIFTGTGAVLGSDRAFEMIIYGSNQSANFTGIENNINAYYDIY